MKIEFININNENVKLIKNITLGDNQENLADPPAEAYEMSGKYKNSFPTVVSIDGEIVAFLIYEALNDEFTRFLIWDFVVSKDFRGRGYGKRIMQTLIEKLRKDYNAKHLELAYVPDNEIARNLYSSLGFRENGKINDDDEIEMELSFE